MSYYVSFFNQSSVITDSELAAALPDFQNQVSDDFAPRWGTDAHLDIGGGGWPVTILDYPDPTIDPAGALGYHFLDGNGRPYARVFARLSLDLGVDPFGVMSHELLEMLANPTIDDSIFIDNGDGTGVLVFQEVCDAPEQLTYQGSFNNTTLSDFVFRNWYEPGAAGQVDFLGQVAGPLQLASGGYVSVDFVDQSSGWTEISADKLPGVANSGRETTAYRRRLHAQETAPDARPTQPPRGRRQRKTAPVPVD